MEEDDQKYNHIKKDDFVAETWKEIDSQNQKVDKWQATTTLKLIFAKSYRANDIHQQV